MPVSFVNCILITIVTIIVIIIIIIIIIIDFQRYNLKIASFNTNSDN